MSAPVMEEAKLIELAAFGDPDAQSKLALHCASKLLAGLTPLESATLAEAFAAQAAAHGRPQDALLFAGVLRVRANHVSQLGDGERACSLLLRSEQICDDLSAVPLCDGAEYLAGVLTAEMEAGGEVGELAAVRLDALLERMTASDADKLRHAVNSAERQAGEGVRGH